MIERVSEKNLDELLPLIEQYQQFYDVIGMSPAWNREFFSQFGESSPLGCQFIYRQNQSPVGFSTVYFCYASTIAAKVGVLNDLYVLPESRGQGIGRELIRYSYHYAISHGAVRLQWSTACDNNQAQGLYDALEAKKSACYFYTSNPCGLRDDNKVMPQATGDVEGI